MSYQVSVKSQRPAALFYCILLLAAFLCTLSCSKKDRLGSSTTTVVIEPGAATLDAGAQLALSAYGRTLQSSRIDISPVWTVSPSERGIFSPVQGPSSVFMAQGSGGFGTIYAQLPDAAGNIQIAVKDANGTVPADTYGIYSEQDRLRLLIEVDSYFGVFPAIPTDGASFDSSSDTTSDVKEGIYAKEATVTVPADVGFAGWYIQYGPEAAADDSISINLSAFQTTGSLKFWVKTPVDLQIGIRSALTTDSDANKAKQYLSEIPGFLADNTWQEISISLLTLAGNESTCDMAAMKDLFIVAVTKDSDEADGSPKTFYIDHVRWEK
ncbi:MAG: hypothetical protein ABII23_01035 [bacterium]